MKVLMNFFLLLMGFSLLSLPVGVAGKTISLVALEYPPYYGKDLPDQGFMTEIIQGAFAESGYQVTVKFRPWKRAFEEAKAGKFDGAYTMWIREERKQWFIFSAPLLPNLIGFYVRKQDPIAFETLEDLKPFKIGVVRGYADPPAFEKATYLQKTVANTDEQNMRKLLLGSIDLALMDKYVGAYVINTKFPDKKNEFVWIDPPLKIDNQYVAFSKKVKNVETKVQAFNEGLKLFLKKKLHQPIMEKHGFAYSEKDFPIP